MNNLLFSRTDIKPLIRSLQFKQQDILNSIIDLHIDYGKIQLDPCYNIGRFYDNGKVEDPDFKFDINPIYPGVEQCDCRYLPFEPGEIESMIFDPPFIVSHKKEFHKNLRKYGYFDSINLLHKMFVESFKEFYRILKHKGIMIVKCQDFIENHKNYYVHIDSVLNPCRKIGFKMIDYFILGSKKRIENRLGTQRFARKYHCYFQVYKKI